MFKLNRKNFNAIIYSLKMSGVKSYQLNLYEEADATKQMKLSVGPTGAVLDYKKNWNLPDESNLGFAMTKLSVDGLGDVKAYGLDRKAEIDTNTSGLAAEIVARGAQDTVLDGKITDEENARVAAVAANATLIGTETANRVSGDAALTAQHNAYVTSNDAAVAAVIATQTANKTTSDNGIATNAAGLAQELLDRAAADTALDGKITVEQTARLAGDAGLQASLDAEIALARSSEAAIQAQITNILQSSPESLNQLSELVAAYTASDNGLNDRITVLENIVASLVDLHN